MTNLTNTLRELVSEFVDDNFDHDPKTYTLDAIKAAMVKGEGG